MGDKLVYQGRLENIINGITIRYEIGNNEYSNGSVENLIGHKEPDKTEQNDVVDSQVYQKPLTNIIRAIQNLMKQENNLTKQDKRIDSKQTANDLDIIFSIEIIKMPLMCINRNFL